MAKPISDEMMDLVDRLGHEHNAVDPRAWRHLLVYAPTPKEPKLPELNGLTSVPCAVSMDQSDRHYGWMFIPHVDGQWVTAAKLEPFSLKIIEHWKAAQAAAPAQQAVTLADDARKNLLAHADDMDVCGWKDDADNIRELLYRPLTPFGMLVRALRIVANTTLGDMAKALLTTPAKLSAMEFGRAPVTSEFALDVSAYFDALGIPNTRAAIDAALQSHSEGDQP